METLVDIVTAVQRLTPAEREELFGRFRELGLEPENAVSRARFVDYASGEFTRALTEHFHQAKRRVLRDAEDKAIGE